MTLVNSFDTKISYFNVFFFHFFDSSSFQFSLCREIVTEGTLFTLN